VGKPALVRSTASCCVGAGALALTSVLFALTPAEVALALGRVPVS
jgi:hypothetical protein